MLRTTLFLITLVFGLRTFAQTNQADISYAGDTVHMEFSGQSQWNYDLKKRTEGKDVYVDLTVPKFSEAGVQALEKFSSDLVKKVFVTRKGPDGRYVVSLLLAKDGLETFDYLTDQPSRLIVDIYKSSEIVDEDQRIEKRKAVQKTAGKKAVKTAELPKKAERKPANDTLIVKPDAEAQLRAGIFDGADPKFERFSMKDYEVKEDRVIAAQDNVYLEFPMLKVDSGRLQTLLQNKPIYEITPKKDEENKQARLLLTLYTNKRFNVFLKAVNWFIEKYPKSEYDEIVRFMWADALYALYQKDGKVEDFDLAMLRYRQAIEKYPTSPLSERAQLLMSFATLDRGDYLQTIRLFEDALRKRPESVNRDIARLAIGDAYLKLNQFDSALAAYGEVESKAFDRSYQAEAAFMKGDAYYQKKDYANAIKEYDRASEKYPDFKNKFPNAIYNRAAAEFNSKEYRKGLDDYRDFLTQYPQHPYAGYAMTRVGELLDVLGADQAKVMGAYLETYFRYGNTPSAVVARLRMLSQRMNLMKPKEVEKAVKDIRALAKDSKLKDIDQFATIMISDGYARRGDFDNSVQMLVKFYQENPTTANLPLLKSRIVGNINRDFSTLLSKGSFIQALQLHNKYADNWLKGSDRVDTQYNLGRAFEQAGVFKDAEENYKTTLNKIYAMRGTAEEKSRAVLENLPSSDQVNLRLAAIAFQQDRFSDSYEYLKNIKAPQTMSEGEQIERVDLSAFLLDKKGDTESATRYLVELIKEWGGQPQLVAAPYATLASYEAKLGRNTDAMKSYQRILELQKDTKQVPEDIHARALENLGRLQVKTNQIEKAKETYADLLELYEAKMPLSSVRYELGKLYFDKGEIKKAEEVWAALKDDKETYWAKLAQEKLDGAEWKNEYKKYLKRIPAMSEGE